MISGPGNFPYYRFMFEPVNESQTESVYKIDQSYSISRPWTISPTYYFMDEWKFMEYKTFSLMMLTMRIFRLNFIGSLFIQYSVLWKEVYCMNLTQIFSVSSKNLNHFFWVIIYSSPSAFVLDKDDGKIPLLCQILYWCPIWKDTSIWTYFDGSLRSKPYTILNWNDSRFLSTN